jgi:hypothetical protein
MAKTAGTRLAHHDVTSTGAPERWSALGKGRRAGVASGTSIGHYDVTTLIGDGLQEAPP